MQAAAKQRHFEVFPENWYAFRLFDAMSTQWNVCAVGARMVFIGLNYTAMPLVHASLRRVVQHAKPLHEVLPQVAVLEARAMSILNA